MSVYFETLDTIYIDIDWLCIDSIDRMYPIGNTSCTRNNSLEVLLILSAVSEVNEFKMPINTKSSHIYFRKEHIGT